MTKWLSHRMVERGNHKRGGAGIIPVWNTQWYDPASKRCDSTGHRPAYRATGGCGSVYPVFYGSSQLYRWISLRQQGFLLSWFYLVLLVPVYTQAVFYKTSLAWLLAVLLVSAGIIFFTQSHAQQEPEAG